MDIAKIGAQSQVNQSGAGAENVSQSKNTGVSFAEVMAGLEVKQERFVSPADQKQPGWREIRAAISSMENSGVEIQDIADTCNDSIIKKLLEMLKEISETGYSPQIGEQLESLMAGMGDEDRQLIKKMLEENGPYAAIQQLVAMFMPAADMPMENTPVSANPDAAAAVLDKTANMGIKQAETAIQDSVPNTEQTVEFVIPPAAAEKTDMLNNGSKGQAQNSNAENMGGLGEAVVEISTSQAQGKDSAMAFSESVRLAKQQMESVSEKQVPKEDKAKPLDVDTLQQQVDSGMHLKNTALVTSSKAAEVEQLSQPVPIASQINEGVLKAMKNGMESITIKLMPEGLGELTLRLTKTANGMMLDMVAKNADTQKLLNGELDTLKENLKPLKVDVETVLTEQQDSFINQNQNFSQHSRQDWKTFKGAAYYKDEPLGKSEEHPAPAENILRPAYTNGYSSALNTYI